MRVVHWDIYGDGGVNIPLNPADGEVITLSEVQGENGRRLEMRMGDRQILWQWYRSDKDYWVRLETYLEEGEPDDVFTKVEIPGAGVTRLVRLNGQPRLVEVIESFGKHE
jgi:hypothetical protein